jgi:hypothetical protein
MKEGKILQFGAGNICLYCGQQKKSKYEEYEQYFECDCSDAKKEREVKAQIEKLKQQLPREKFEVREEQVLYKIKD